MYVWLYSLHTLQWISDATEVLTHNYKTDVKPAASNGPCVNGNLVLAKIAELDKKN